MTAPYSLSLVIAGLLFGVATSFAQFPRTVVIEEFTAVDCTPCVQAGRNIDRLVNEKGDRVVAIRYQVKFFVNNPYATPEAEGRRTYYTDHYSTQGGLPDGYVDGKSLPSLDYNPVFVITEDELAVEAPLKIDVTQTREGGGYAVKVKVTSGSLPVDGDNYRLHVIAVERQHTDTSLRSLQKWNGEEVLHDLKRTMLTGLNGANFSIAENTSATFDYTYTLDPSWQADQMYVVAFVQNIATVAPAAPAVVQAGFSPRPALADVPQSRTLPAGYSFDAPVPNPAATSTLLRFTLGQPSVARLLVHDVMGRLVRSVDLGRREAGEGSVPLDVDGLAAGSYTCTVEAGEVRMTRGVIIH